MDDFAIDPPTRPVASVRGGGVFPIRRIFCIGKNYADHVKEMGYAGKAADPVYFTKPADAIVASGTAIAYPLASDNVHFEGELVVGLKSGGMHLSEDGASSCIFGYAAGCDLTRRDHQARSKEFGSPWDAAKGFDNSAPLGEICPINDCGDINAASLKTTVNAKVRQDAQLSQMIWTVPKIIAGLSTLFELAPGDLIFTGTPEGVGPLIPGDKISVEINGLSTLNFSIAVD